MADENLIRQVVNNVLRRVDAERPARVPTPAATPLENLLDRSQPSEADPEEDLTPAAFFAPWTGEVFQAAQTLAPLPSQPRLPAGHPSQEQFNLDEAAEINSAISELVEFFEAQRCTIEQGKPCDHCGTCRGLGF